METSQIILLVFIGLLLIAYPIMMVTRNKKDRQRMTEQTNSLKRGDKVLTTSGIYGIIVDLHLENDTKIVTIETGTGKNKGYISVDAYSVYTVINDEAVEEPKQAEVKAEIEKPQENEQVEDKKQTELVEEKVVGKRQSKKKNG